MANLTYTRTGDYYLPNLTLPDNAAHPLGKYARMRHRHLQENHPVLYNVLLLSGKLYPHLQESDSAARARMELLMHQLMQTAGVTEELKAADPMRWAGLINALKAQAEEILMFELVYEDEHMLTRTSSDFE